MKTSVLLKTGIIGTIVAAICCFTPALVILLGAVGLSSILGWLDFILLPALGIFVLITMYALWERRRPESN
jgi:mercuric ion transport protein